MIRFFAFLMLFSPGVAAVLAADETDDIVFYTESGYAEFTSRVPLHTFTGESNDLTGMIDFRENVIDFYLDLSTIKTGIGRRDRDTYRTLNIEDHPFAEFTGTLEAGFDTQSPEKQAVVASGDFTINGVTRDVQIEGTLQLQGDELVLEAEWSLFLEDHNIDPPGILFYRVNEEQEIRIEVTLTAHDREMFSSR